MKKDLRGIAIGMTAVLLYGGVCMPSVVLAENNTDRTDVRTNANSTINPIRLEVDTIPVGNAYIPKEMIVSVELVEELTSKKNRVGDVVQLKTLDNIIINDVVVVPAGSTVSGKVTKCTSSGLFGRAGKLEFTIDSVKSVNGIEIPLQYTDLKEAGSDDGAVAVAVVSLLGGLFMKGKNVSFPAGSKMSAKVVADTDLKVRLEDLAEAMNPAKPHGVIIQIRQ